MFSDSNSDKEVKEFLEGLSVNYFYYKNLEYKPEINFINLENGSKPYFASVKDGWDTLNFDENTPYYKILPHFWGGWIGYIAYEASGSFEKLPKRKRGVFCCT